MNRLSARTVLGVLCATSVAMIPTNALATTSNGVAPSYTRASDVALTWTAEYMSNDHAYTVDEAEEIAKDFDLVAAMPVAFRGEVDDMRVVNPDLHVVSYSNAMFADADAAAGLPESAFAHAVTGERITSTEFGLYLMEPTSPQWRQRAAETCAKKAAYGGYDGCLLDMLTMGVFAPNYVSDLPARPGTGREYTQTEWRQELVNVVASQRTLNPGLSLIGNAVGNAFRFWDNDVTTQPIVEALPGAQMEDFLRGATNAVSKFPTPAEWVKNVRAIEKLEADGETGLFTTKVWVSPTAAQNEQWQGYALASFLMGANGHSYMSYTSSRDKAGVTGLNNPYAMPKDLGQPLGAMSALGDLYKRRFANGVSLVNPTNVAWTVKLNTPMVNLAGETVSSFTLGANSGTVLKNPTGLAGGDVASAVTTQLDLLAPTVSVPTASQSGTTTLRNVTLSGSASDNVGVASITVAVQSVATSKWLQADGTWGPFVRLTVAPSVPGAKTATWSLGAKLGAGKYGLNVQAQDVSGNSTPAPLAWKAFTIS